MDVTDFSNNRLSDEVILNGSFLTVASPPPKIIRTSYHQKLSPVKPNSLLKEKLLSASDQTSSAEILFDESSQTVEASLSGFPSELDVVIQQPNNPEINVPDEENQIPLRNETADNQAMDTIGIPVQHDDTNFTPLTGGNMFQFVDNTGQNRIVYIPTGSITDQALSSNSLDSVQLGNLLLNSNAYLLGSNDQPYPVIQESSGSEVIVTPAQTQELAEQATTLTIQFPTPETGVIHLPVQEPQQAVHASASKNYKRRKHGGGWPKGKKRTSTKNKIRSPNTAYVLYGKERRKQIAEETPGLTFAEITRKVSKEWNDLDAETKTKYLENAERDMERFKQEVLQFQQTDRYKTILEQRSAERLESLETMNQHDPMKKNLKRILESDDPDVLYCKVCDQFFSSTHNKTEHMTGRSHLRKLNVQMIELEKKYEERTNQFLALEPDHSMQMTDFMEQFIAKNSERELELETLRTNLELLKKSHTDLNKQLQALKDTEVKLKQEIETMKQWSGQIMHCIDNLKMVPTLFGVINF